MKLALALCFLYLSLLSQAAIFSVGSAVDCDYHDLQIAIDDALQNGELNNYLRLVNDGSFNQQDYTVDFSALQGLELIGGYATCNDANADNVTGKTTIDAGDIVVGQAIFTVSQQINNSNLFFSIKNMVLKNSKAQLGAALMIDSVNSFMTNVDITQNESENGAGVYCRSGISVRLDMLDVNINNNHALHNGGGLYLEGNSGLGCQLILQSTNRQSTFANNQADNNGGALFIDKYPQDETIFAFAGNQTDYFAVIFSDNSAINGGAVYHSDGNVIFDDSKFTGNHASINGGAIYSIDHDDPFNLIGMSVTGEMSNNSAEVSGGAIYSHEVLFGAQLKAINNSSPTAAFAEVVGGTLQLGDSLISNHQNAQNLIKISNSATGLGKLTLNNVTIKDNNNLTNLIETEFGQVYMQRCYVFKNHLNNALFNKVHFTGQFNDMFYFNTIADNTATNAIFAFDDNTFAILDNIIWNPNTTIFDVNNSSGSNNCNILSSQVNDVSGTNNTLINPQFVNPNNDDYRVKVSSRAVDYCQYDNNPPFGFNSQDVYDLDFVENLFGIVDIGAYKFSAFEFIFVNSFN